MKKIILIIIAIILILFTMLLFIVNSNNSYDTKLIKEINKNYKEEVTYVNKQGNSYIVKTKDKVVVLNEEYKEVTSEELKNIKELNYDIVYKKNKLMYQKSEVKKRSLIYTYYDINSGKEIDKLEIEG